MARSFLQRALVTSVSLFAFMAATLPAALLAEEPLNLRFIPEEAVAAVVVQPRAFLTADAMEMLPVEVLSAAAIDELGVDPVDVKQVVLVVGPPSPQGPPQVGVVVHLTKEYEREAIVSKLVAMGKENGFATGGMPNAKTVWMAQPGIGPAMKVADGKGDSPLLTLMREKADPSSHVQAYVSVAAVRDFAKVMLQMAPPLPGPFAGAKQLPDQLDSIRLSANVGEAIELKLSLDAVDEAAGAEVEQLLNMALAVGKQIAMSEAVPPQLAQSDDPVEQASAKYIKRMIDLWAKMLTPTRDGSEVVIQLETPGGVASLGVMAAMAMPAVANARESARSALSKSNLRQMAIALISHEVRAGQLPPPAIVDADGKPLLSWRVAILPYIDQQNLYEAFHLDEPWNSEHNRKLLSAMPNLFQNPNLPESHKTTYLLVTGPGTMFPEQGKPSATSRAIDGSTNTICVVEVDAEAAVEWTRPADWQFDPDEPNRNLGELRDGVFNAVFVDSHVEEVSVDVDWDVLRAMFTAAGGEVILKGGTVDIDE